MNYVKWSEHKTRYRQVSIFVINVDAYRDKYENSKFGATLYNCTLN